MNKKRIFEEKQTIKKMLLFIVFLVLLSGLFELILNTPAIFSFPFIFLFGNLSIYASAAIVFLFILLRICKNKKIKAKLFFCLFFMFVFLGIYFSKDLVITEGQQFKSLVDNYADAFKQYKTDSGEIGNGLVFLTLSFWLRSLLSIKLINIFSFIGIGALVIVLMFPIIKKVFKNRGKRKEKKATRQKHKKEKLKPEELETLEFDDVHNEYIGDEFVETVSETKKVVKEEIKCFEEVDLFNESDEKANIENPIREVDDNNGGFDVTQDDLYINKKIDIKRLDILPKQEFNVITDEIEGDIIATDVHGNRLKNIHVDESVRDIPADDFYNDSTVDENSAYYEDSVPPKQEQNIYQEEKVSEVSVDFEQEEESKSDVIDESEEKEEVSYEYKNNYGFDEEVVSPNEQRYPDMNAFSNSAYHELHYDEQLNTNPTKQQKYELPPLSLLDNPKTIDTTENQMNATIKSEKLNTKLQSLGVKGRVHGYIVAPAFTRFQIEVDDGYRVKGLQEIRDDIMMCLEAEQINILTPIPGTSYAGVDIPNKVRTNVTFKECLMDIPYEKKDHKLVCAIGKDCLGKTVYIDLFETQHLLVAGTTGSGKSSGLSSIVMSLIMRDTPDDIKFLLIDPKGGEFKFYSGIPHLLCPVIKRADEANEALKRIIKEVMRRNDVISANDSREIVSYNQKAKEQGLEVFPYIVVIIDELQTLMEDFKADIEASIKTITAFARSVGVYLICSTQSPRKEIITGIIRANLPSCIAFAVRSQVDSRVVMDEIGAENLLGRGDMLLKLTSSHTLNRVQGCFVSDDEKIKVVKFWNEQSTPIYNELFNDLKPSVPEAFKFNGSESDRSDEYYPQVLEWLLTLDEISITMIQRRFGMGQPRAGKIIDMLEQDGYISSKDGNKPRMIFRNKLPGYNESLR